MNKFTNISSTLFDFVGSLGYSVYLEGQVPSESQFPYVTISYEVGGNIGGKTVLQGRIWSKSGSREEVNKISDKINNMIGEGVKLTIKNNEGYIALYKGSPFIQAIPSEYDTIQVNYFNLEMQVY